MMLSLLPLLTLFSTASASCHRSFLRARGADYLSAQLTGTPSTFLSHAAPNLTYIENNVALSPNSSNITLNYPLKIDYNYTVYDTFQCATFTELVSASDPHPYIIHTRVEYAAEKAVLLESVVTDRGDWLFNASTALKYISAESWPSIPAANRSSRETLQHIGDLYFDRFANASVVIPWGPPCARIEGGLYANSSYNSTTGTCNQVLPSTIVVPYRRYVVDDEAGVVDVFVGFPGLDRTQEKKAMPDSHLMRVEGGMIRYMHTASACVTPGCGEFDPDDPLCEAEGRCTGN